MKAEVCEKQFLMADKDIEQMARIGQHCILGPMGLAVMGYHLGDGCRFLKIKYLMRLKSRHE